MSEDLYELLKRKDAELAAYRELVDKLRSHVASAAADHAHSEEWKHAWDGLGSVFHECGFKSDGSWRG